jgi:hypothetical protein
MKDMNFFYLSIATVIILAVISIVKVRKTPRKIFYVIICSNIAFAAIGSYYISWMVIFPCLFIIAFMLALSTHPYIRAGNPIEKHQAADE